MSVPEGVVLRPAVADDAEAGADLHIACWRAAYGPLVGREVLESRLVDRARWVDAWHAQLAGGPPRTLAVAGDELVGFGVAGPTRDDERPVPQELYAIYVRESWWGTGLGQALMDAAVPPGATSLWVLETNLRARAFYARNGFVPDGGRHHYAGLDAWEIRMVRP